MRLYLQRDISDCGARYQVNNERGEPIYRITGKRGPSGESRRIRDMRGDTVCKIRSLGFSALSVYSVSAGAETIRLNIAVSGGRAAVRFRGISFCIRGDVLMGNYEILDADTAVVCAVYRDFAKGYTQLTLNQPERELFCVAAASCIADLTVDRLPALQMT